MITKSPSGGLSPYYYKNGYFHAIHYGSYFDDSSDLFSMMEKEEIFILKSFERRRILIDLYETNLSKPVIEKLMEHIEHISPNIIKISITSDRKSLCQLHKVFRHTVFLKAGQIYLCTDMEEGKTWLVRDF